MNRRVLLHGSTYRKRVGRKLLYSLITSPSFTIISTTTKIKFLQRKVEKLVHKMKTDMNLVLMRKLNQMLYNNKTALHRFITFVDTLNKRNGGYTRVLHANYRPGDGASMSQISFVE